jgi:hypothetical protein
MNQKPDRGQLSQWAFDVDIRLDRALAERDQAAVKLEYYKQRLADLDGDIVQLKNRSAELHGQLKETER